MKTLRYAIVGAGMMGQEHIRYISMLTDSVISVICDPDDTMRAASLELAQSLGHKNVRCAADPHELSINHLADCVVVASPNHTHIDVLHQLLPLSLPLLIEKPVCTSMEQIERLQRSFAGYTAPVWVAMEYRYMPPTARLLDVLHAGEIGSLRMLSIREHRYPFLEKVGDWNRFNINTGGTMVEKCCHFFDLMCLMTDQSPVRLYASGGADVNHVNERYQGEQPDIVDNAFVCVDFESGTRAMLDLCMFAEGSDPQETITAVGDRGKLEVNIPGPRRLWQKQGDDCATLVRMQRSPTAPIVEKIVVEDALLEAGDHYGSTYYQHVKFQHAVRGIGPVEVTLEDGLRAVAVGLAAEESIAGAGVRDLTEYLSVIASGTSTRNRRN